MMNNKRETAYKVRIVDILNGKYVINEGWKPNYIEVGNKRFSRVNVLGTVVGFENDLIKIDDGTGQIMLRSFDESNTMQQNVGDVLLIIGRPREYNEIRFLVPEIIKKIDNPEWIKVRNLEIKEEKVTKVKKIKEEKVEENTNQKILDIIKEKDKGNGVNTEEIIKIVGKSNTEKNINKLLEEGEIFEIKPGILKLLS